MSTYLCKDRKKIPCKAAKNVRCGPHVEQKPLYVSWTTILFNTTSNAGLSLAWHVHVTILEGFPVLYPPFKYFLFF